MVGESLGIVRVKGIILPLSRLRLKLVQWLAMIRSLVGIVSLSNAFE